MRRDAINRILSIFATTTSNLDFLAAGIANSYKSMSCMISTLHGT